MHIAKNCLHYPSLKNLEFLKQYNYLQIFYSFVWLKKISTMNSKTIKKLYFLVQM